MAQTLRSVSDVQLSSDECISPVPELLGTNTVPSSTEADAIKHLLIDIDNELDYLESILPKQTARRDRLTSVADSHRALLSPARRVYPEILSEIFSWSPGAPTQDPCAKLPENFDPHDGPLLFTQICRSWRQAAIATPSLWSTIRFVLGRRSKVKLIDMWLERSRDSDLTIAILDRSSPGCEVIALRDLPFNAEAIRLLASQAHRWKSIFLHLPPQVSCEAYWDALSGAKGNIGRLQQLSVHVTIGQMRLTMPGIFTGGPLLTSLTLNHRISGDALPIDESRITNFSYQNSALAASTSHFVPIAECIKAIRRFPNLKDCDIKCKIHPITNITDVTMSKLAHLHIKVCYEDTPASTSDTGALWRVLQLPNLTHLVVGSPDRRFRFHREELPGLISRCLRLTTLVLAFASAQPQELIEILRKAPNVKHLAVGSASNLSLFFTSLSRPTTALQIGVLPRLETIRVTVPTNIKLSPTDDGLFPTWVRMALSRMDAAAIPKSEDSGYDLLESAILDLKLQDVLGRAAALQYLQASLDKFGPANWNRTISVGLVSHRFEPGGSPHTGFTIRRRRHLATGT